ncbi:MAG: hypothetical protein QOE82_2099 [Thermoanaerobaculia bacterium]|jgi:hypothetical protein|nr:hypothetical protein [Thermoanaerobaculia bacterium]
MNFGIRIVEKSSNRRGDLFARLMSDLFVSLGYDEIRLNVAKAGREIDLKGRHRFEERRIVVECKAAKEPAGGDVVNKFVGVLDAERRRYSGETIGYLISLGGFRQTAIEQEEDLGSRRVILMDAEKVARELVHGRILVSSDIAIAIGLVCASKIEHQLSLVMPLELLATRFGWVWLIRFGYGGLCTHYALIHADGSSMPSRAVLDVLEDDHALCRDLGTALFLQGKRDTEADIDATRERYLRYLSEQCGEIQLAGLPADEEVGSRRLRLEKLFVPLHLDPLLRADSDAKECRLSLGKVLKKQTRIAILGAPGVGKSTLIKRVAVAYSDPSRRKEVADDLPERN